MYKILCILLLMGSLCAKETFIVATNAEFQPFTFIDKDTVVGFDIDVAREVCKRLDVDMQLKDMPFEALIAELMLGRVHFVAAGMSYTEERAKKVLFTSSYLSGDPLLIVSVKKPLTLEELQGASVVVNEGYTADTFLSTMSGINLVRLPTATDGFLALKQGRCDAFVTAKSTLTACQEVQKEMQFYTTVLHGTDQTCALVLSKKQPDLHAKIEATICAMSADGTIDTLKAKWGFS